MRKRELKNMEWWVLIIAIILCSIGLIALFSATQETEHDAFYKQIIWIGISLFVMVIFTVIDYEAIVKASPIFYIVFLILLVAVLFTKPVNGATSWFDIGFFSLQPSEFAKVFVILFMTYVITKIQAQKRENINKITKIICNIAYSCSSNIVNNKRTRLWYCCSIYSSHNNDAIYSRN